MNEKYINIFFSGKYNNEESNIIRKINNEVLSALKSTKTVLIETIYKYNKFFFLKSRVKNKKKTIAIVLEIKLPIINSSPKKLLTLSEDILNPKILEPVTL